MVTNNSFVPFITKQNQKKKKFQCLYKMHVAEWFLSLIRRRFPDELRPRSLEQFMWINTTQSNLRLFEGTSLTKKLK